VCEVDHSASPFFLVVVVCCVTFRHHLDAGDRWLKTNNAATKQMFNIQDIQYMMRTKCLSLLPSLCLSVDALCMNKINSLNESFSSTRFISKAMENAVLTPQRFLIVSNNMDLGLLDTFMLIL